MPYLSDDFQFYLLFYFEMYKYNLKTILYEISSVIEKEGDGESIRKMH